MRDGHSSSFHLSYTELFTIIIIFSSPRFNPFRVSPSLERENNTSGNRFHPAPRFHSPETRFPYFNNATARLPRVLEKTLPLRINTE
ncbi:hypothetical protein TNIN_152271 [Trichonephila inaurata madagascariensis]|uniref:Uncharacterized protein n=1 Tax=Trichonephila inaurata madagascariensis TaxID=2747483 RepID=A0A8X7C5M2_9ARAC|nr:hypothetical protein TNIN_152271 [Trichonephila inaurata madagascariensis]